VTLRERNALWNVTRVGLSVKIAAISAMAASLVATPVCTGLVFNHSTAALPIASVRKDGLKILAKLEVHAQFLRKIEKCLGTCILIEVQSKLLLCPNLRKTWLFTAWFSGLDDALFAKLMAPVLAGVPLVSAFITFTFGVFNVFAKQKLGLRYRVIGACCAVCSAARRLLESAPLL